ncbi:MAG: hypothetical protein ACRDHN_03505 [Thermomicrobiales bacterium]
MTVLNRRRAITLGLGSAISLQLPRFAAGNTFAQEATPMPDYHPIIDPATFVAKIDNPYMPMAPGAMFTYMGTSDGQPQQNTVSVTSESKMILGVACVVVRDQVFADGELLEDTYDWFAQDNLGQVWYFGEASTAYEDGKTSTEGSWEAGVDGAYPGIVMQAQPVMGDPYRQEYYSGEAEDMAQVIEVDGEITVPFGSFTQTITTKEWTPLEPGIVEHKTYAPGIGFVYSIAVSGEDEEFALVDFQSSAATPIG